MIDSLNDLLADIRKENLAFQKKVKASGGWNQFLRAIATQILWLFMLYLVASALVPITDKFMRNAVILMIAESIRAFVLPALKSRKIEWPGKLIKGEYFHVLTVRMLNACFIGLTILCAITIYALPKAVAYVTNYHENERK